MRKLRPVEHARRLVEVLRASTDARERLLARILDIEIPRLASRRPKVRYSADFDLSYVVVHGTDISRWDSDKDGCDYLAKMGCIAGSGTTDSLSARLYKAVLENRDAIRAVPSARHAERTFARLIAALDTGKLLIVRDPFFSVCEEESELETLVGDVEKSIRSEKEKTLAECPGTSETL